MYGYSSSLEMAYYIRHSCVHAENEIDGASFLDLS